MGVVFDLPVSNTIKAERTKSLPEGYLKDDKDHAAFFCLT